MIKESANEKRSPNENIIELKNEYVDAFEVIKKSDYDLEQAPAEGKTKKFSGGKSTYKDVLDAFEAIKKSDYDFEQAPGSEDDEVSHYSV